MGVELILLYDKNNLLLNIMLSIKNTESLYFGFNSYNSEDSFMQVHSVMDVSRYCSKSQGNKLVFSKNILFSALKICKEEGKSLLIAHTHIDGDKIFNASPSFEDLVAERFILNECFKENYHDSIIFAVINKNTINLRLYVNSKSEPKELCLNNLNSNLCVDKGNIKLFYDKEMKKGFIYISSYNIYKKITISIYNYLYDLIQQKLNGTIIQRDELLLYSILGNIINNSPIFKLADTKDMFESKTVDNINVILGNQCNLKCRYCYATEGTYNSPFEIFSFNKFKDRILCLIRNYSITRVDNLSFFGGEPLLYIDNIREICIFMNDLYAAGEIVNKTAYSVITNGTIINEKIISTLKEYGIKLTISLDGNKFINDINRKYKNGKGTYDDIICNIEVLRKNGINVELFEVTYTNEHVKAGIKKKDIFNYLYSKFSKSRVTIVDCMGELSPHETDDLTYVQNDIVHTLTKLKDSSYDGRYYELKYDNECNRVIQILKGDNVLPDLHCDIGLRGFTIYPNGSIYPCQLFISDEYKLCDADNNFNAYDFSMNVNKYSYKLLKSNIEECNNCWCKNFCVVCAKRVIDKVEMKKICAYRKYLVEKILVALV